MIYLIEMKIKYYTFYFRFEYLDNATALVERIKRTLVPELSDDVDIKITIEVLTEEEYSKKIKEMED